MLSLFAQPQVRSALTAGMIAALATAAGVLPVPLAKQVSEKLRNTMLGFGADRRGHEGQATMGLISGFAIMMLLDTALG